MIRITGTPKEIAALVLELQGRQEESSIERAVRWFMEMQATTLLLALVMWAVIEVLLPAILDVIDEEKEDAG